MRLPAGKIGGPGRREVGHGALAEKALAAVLPGPSELPFMVRVSAEVTGSSGSSSMAAVCGGWLALKHAQVPVRDTVAGISIGLVGCRGAQGAQREGEYALLTDIQGAEDHLGGWGGGMGVCEEWLCAGL
jgi:polyribonucleotide nucleotidyltransferase